MHLAGSLKFTCGGISLCSIALPDQCCSTTALKACMREARRDLVMALWNDGIQHFQHSLPGAASRTRKSAKLQKARPTFLLLQSVGVASFEPEDTAAQTACKTCNSHIAHTVFGRRSDTLRPRSSPQHQRRAMEAALPGTQLF